jgi:polyhydroxyalkanoate synthesis regulator phasin
MIELINESHKTGRIDKKQAHDIREAIKASCTDKHNITAQNDVIIELNRRVAEAVKHYR